MNFRALLFLLFIFAVNLQIFSQSDIGFELDYAKFNYDDESVYLEVYYSYAQNTLFTKEVDSKTFISSDLTIKIEDSLNNSIVDEIYKLNTVVDTSSSNYKNEDLIGVIGFKLPIGLYALTVTVKDNYGRRDIKTISDKLDLSSLSLTDLSISDVQLCSKIIKEGANQNSIYYKNSLEIIPNPKGIYGVNLPVLYYYSEFYNNTNTELNNLVFKRVIEQNGGYFDLFEENVTLTSGAIVKAGLINLSELKSGRYSLNLILLNSKDSVLTSRTKNFFVYNPQNALANNLNESKQSYIKSEFGILNEEECDYLFEVSNYIAAESEKSLYESLVELNSKRQFLYEFWKKRDAEPETELNEFYEKYKSMVEYVNSNYGHRHKKGYKTDRGRVALLYGIPDQIDTRSNEADLKPYEIWAYNALEGGVSFIFGDTMGISEFELLHSNKRGEVQNTNWEDRLTIKGGF